jgi:DNA-binding GntR family transcriptional regulator
LPNPRATARNAPTAGPRAESQTDQAYDVLEEQIVTLRLEPGAVLSENRLADTLGFGRTPIREALQRLARESLVAILPRKGILVAEINPRKQLLALEVRRELERLMARAGAIRATPEEKARFLEIAEGMERAARDNDDISFMRFDHELNFLVSKAAHNEYASRAMGLLHGMSRRFWYMHYKEAADLPLCARLHAQLARRIAAGEPEEAARASDQLVDYAETFTRATVGAGALSVGGQRNP